MKNLNGWMLIFSFALLMFSCIILFTNATKHYTIQKNIYYLNGEKVLEQTFNPKRAKIILSWKSNDLTQKKGK